MAELRGDSNNGWAVWGGSNSGTGVVGTAGTGTGTYGESGSSYGVFGTSGSGAGVVGDNESDYSPAVWGHNRSNRGTAVVGTAGKYGIGMHGKGDRGYGVLGQSGSHSGVYGHSYNSVGVRAVTRAKDSFALYADNIGGLGGTAVWCSGNLVVVNGNKAFKIDHPLDPQNRYLVHNAVESSERKNVYDGIAWLDEDGTAWVDLPEWFEALNEDFRYQLTAVGGAAQNLHVAEEIYENRFKIAGGEGRMTVCWQVTGSRKDAWAAANPFVVEEEKPPEERGRYLQPDLHNAPAEQRVHHDPDEEERLQQMMRQEEPPQPPQVPTMPLGFAAPGFGRQEEENRRQIDELREQIAELKRKR